MNFSSIVWISILLAIISCAGRETTDKFTEIENPPELDSIESVYPKLNVKGGSLSDFVPEGWFIFDTIPAYINHDDLMDYAIVLQTIDAKPNTDVGNELTELRILAVIFSDRSNTLLLSAQSNTIMLTSQEGGMMGDPYQGLDVSKGMICTLFWGGSSTKWNLSHCFKLKDGIWRLCNVSTGGGNNLLGESSSYDLETGEFNYSYSEEEYFEEKDSIAVIASENYSKVIRKDTIITIDRFVPWTLELDKKVSF